MTFTPQGVPTSRACEITGRTPSGFRKWASRMRLEEGIELRVGSGSPARWNESKILELTGKEVTAEPVKQSESSADDVEGIYGTPAEVTREAEKDQGAGIVLPQCDALEEFNEADLELDTGSREEPVSKRERMSLDAKLEITPKSVGTMKALLAGDAVKPTDWYDLMKEIASL